jgi:hypothetical protein
VYSHLWKRFELREKHHKANSINGVVGRTGKNTPIKPKPKNSQPKINNSGRIIELNLPLQDY